MPRGKGKRKDMWILELPEEGGFKAPMHVTRVEGSFYVCDQRAKVKDGKLTILDLPETEKVHKADVMLEDIVIERLPEVADVDRHWYASTVEFQQELREAFKKTLPLEVQLREKIRREKINVLARRRLLLIDRVTKVLARDAEAEAK